MTLEQFRNQIAGKIFVELQGDAVSSFTNLDPESEGASIRTAATNAGVIVFLTSVHKIFAKGYYYGCDPDAFATALTNISSLQSSLHTLGNAISTLNDTVALQGNDINALETWTTEKATTIANNVQNIATLQSNLQSLQAQVNALDPNASGDTNPIQDAIDARINALLGFDKKEDAQDETYTWDNTENGGTFTQAVKNLQTYVTQLQSAVTSLTTSLADKADLLDFNTLATKLGSNAWPWSNDPNAENETIVTVVNKHTTQITTLNNAISGIPHFNIEVLESEADLPVDSVNNRISRSTIFLVKQQSQSGEGEGEGQGEGQGQSQNNNREMFTEYIWVNKNAYDDNLQEDWGWERLGCQFFNIESYVDEETLEAIKDDLEAQIEAITNQFNSNLISRIESTESTLTTLSNQYTALATELHTLIENGVFKLTGEDIKTTAAGNTYIADDIAALQSGKLDANTLNWVVVGEAIQGNEQNSGD